MSHDYVRVTPEDGIAVVRLDRPPANAIDLPLAAALDHAFTDLDSSSADVGAVVVTGNGPCFSAGLDLKAVPSYTTEQQRDLIVALGRLIGRLYALPQPTVAAVNGHAVAAGTLLTLACDYRIGPEGDSTFGLTGVRAGIPYPVAAHAVITAELAPRTVRTMLLGGETFNSAEALRRGILDETTPRDGVLARAMDVARERAALPRDAYARIKRQLRRAPLEQIRRATDEGADPYLASWLTAEAVEASARVLGSP